MNMNFIYADGQSVLQVLLYLFIHAFFIEGNILHSVTVHCFRSRPLHLELDYISQSWPRIWI